jgi:molybdate transport system regulatory protein
MENSARNRLAGVVETVKLGNVMAQIEIRVGNNRVVSVITRDAAEELGLKEGDEVVAVVKSTDVMVGKL